MQALRAGQYARRQLKRPIRQILSIDFTPKTGLYGDLMPGCSLLPANARVSMQPISSRYADQLAALKVLIVDDENTMRKVTRYKPESDPGLSQLVLINWVEWQ
jgi:hypothetical protein